MTPLPSLPTVATATVLLECKGGPAGGEVVELPWDAGAGVTVRAGTCARDLYVVGTVNGRRRLVWAGRR